MKNKASIVSAVPITHNLVVNCEGTFQRALIKQKIIHNVQHKKLQKLLIGHDKNGYNILKSGTDFNGPGIEKKILKIDKKCMIRINIKKMCE
jgi:hypothetical protein